MKRTHITIAVAALVVFASLSLPAAPAAGQMDERTKQGMGLTTDSLEAILKDLQTYDTSDVGAAMRLRAYVFVHKDNARPARRPRPRFSSSSRAHRRQEG